MAFISRRPCNVCGEVKDIFINLGGTCEDCKRKIRRQNKLDWMNKQNEKSFENRLRLLENYVYDNFVAGCQK